MSPPENDRRLIGPWDIPVAVALLTRVPQPPIPDAAFDRQAKAAWAFPVVGFLVGAATACLGFCAFALGVPLTLVAGLCLAAQMVMTGAMHEDGFADSVDGLWGGWTADRRLEIMKDSHIGTYGVLALVISTGLRWMALSMVLAQSVWLLIPVAVLSRSGLPAMMTLVPRARPGGLSDRVGDPGAASAALALAFGAVTALVAFGPTVAVPAVLISAAVVIAIAWLAKAKIGGQTGDILGASQHCVEIALLLMLASQIT